MYKRKLFIPLALLLFFSLSLYPGCDPDDGGVEPDAPSCTNGIQDGDETGVDCGGSCEPCQVDYLCDGTDEDSYMPFTTVKKWTYKSSDGGGSTYSFLGTEDVDGVTKYRVNVKGNTGFINYIRTYRIDSNGDIIGQNADDAYEFLEIPVGRAIGYTWTNENNTIDTYELKSKNASYTTEKCSYDGLMEIFQYRNGGVYKKLYYKKGLGRVDIKKIGSFSGDTYLSDVEVN